MTRGTIVSEQILKMVNITKRFAGIVALDQVHFSCNRGEVHVLAGENGAGKSTILKILSGIYKADEGEIYFNDKKATIKNPEQAQKLGIAMVFQELTLIGELTVSENIYLSIEPKNKLGLIDQKAVNKQIQTAMDKYGIYLEPDEIVNNLPIAKQQLAEILKILVRDPDLIILDEPTSALARKEVDQLFQIIRNLTANGKTIIFISHRLEEVFAIGDRVTVFKDGRFVDTCNICDINEDDLIRMMVGRSLQNIFPHKNRKIDNEIIFEVRLLLDHDKKVNDVSFNVHRGEILCVAGLQGHGQSELLNAISGLHPLKSGEVIISGKKISVKNSGQAIENGIALVPADRKSQGLMLELAIQHNLSISSLGKRLKGLFIDSKAESIFCSSIVEQLAIKIGKVTNPANSLSGGNQQKVVLGKELATNPKVILFDEPTRGIDVEAKREFYNIMDSLASQGVAVIMNSSDLMEVIGMADRVAVMYEGRISGILQKEEISEEAIMRYAMGITEKYFEAGETA